MRIAVYTIAKDEAPRIARCVASAAGADMHLVLDTGSTDGTRAAAAQAGARVEQIAVLPWRFDVARNCALAMLPADVDVCIALEADEVLVDGWRAKVEAAWTPGTVQLCYGFQWAAGVTFERDRIHARSGFAWRGITHEGLYRDARCEGAVARISDVLVIDLPPEGRCGGAHYLPMLHAWASESPRDTRAAFYYARELFFAGKHDKAVVEFDRFMELQPTYWAEIEYAHRAMAHICAERGQTELSNGFYRGAIAAGAGRVRAPYLWFARALAKRGLTALASDVAAAGLAIGDDAPEGWTEDAAAWSGELERLAGHG